MGHGEENPFGPPIACGLRLDPRMSGASEAWHIRWCAEDSHGVVFVPVEIAAEAWQAELHALNYLLCVRRPISRADIDRRAAILVRSDTLPRLRNLFAMSRQLREYFQVLDTEYADLPLRAASPGMPWPRARTEAELAWATDHRPTAPSLNCQDLGRVQPTRRALCDVAALDTVRAPWPALERFCAHARAFDSIGDRPNRRMLISDVTGWTAIVVDGRMVSLRAASTFELIRCWTKWGGARSRIQERLAREADPKARACLLRLLIDRFEENPEVRFANGRAARLTGHAIDRVMTRCNAANLTSAISLLRRAAMRAYPYRLPTLVEFFKAQSNVGPADYFKTRDGWEFTVSDGQLVSVFVRTDDRCKA